MSSRRVVVGLFCTAFFCILAVQAADPPPPDYKNPVDYVKWTNEKYGEGVKENAADTYREAIAAFVRDEDALKLAATRASSWTADQRATLSDYVKRNAQAVEHYAAAARVPRYFVECNGASGALMGWTLPDLRPLRELATLTATRARLRVSDGNVDTALEDITTLLRVNQHLQAQPTIIQYLVGMAIGGLAYNTLLDVPLMATGAMDYQQVMAKLKDADKPPRRPLDQLEWEKVSAWDAAQRFLRDADGDGRFETLEWADEQGPRPHKLDPPQKFDEIVREIGEYFDQWRDVFVPDYREAKKRADELDERLQARRGSILGVLGVSVTRVAELPRRFIASRNAYHAVFSLHAYKAKNGRWPNDLKDALPEKEALDPFSGKPLCYRLKDGAPLLYSVSRNGTDDGGEGLHKDGGPAWGDTGDYVFWPRGEG